MSGMSPCHPETNRAAAAHKARVNPNPAANPKVTKQPLATAEGIAQAAKMASFGALLGGCLPVSALSLVPTKRAETVTPSTAGTPASTKTLR